jgi:uncharacterized protein
VKKILLGVLLAVSAFAIDTSKLKPTGYVNDFAHALNAVAAARLEAYCASVERATGVQLAIVLIDTLEDDPIEEVANKLYHEWGIGKKGKDEGLLLLVAVKDHKQRAEIGYGLEGTINDGYAGGVLRGIRPILRQGNYGGALLAAAQQFGDKIAQEKGVAISGPRPDRRERPSGGRGFGLPFPVILIGIFALLWIVGRFTGGGRAGGGMGSGAGGFLAGMFLGNLMGRGGGWGGGGFGGHDDRGGGGGFGGFGGGDSGGGGASSDW